MPLLKQAIQEPAGWSLIFVYGPTGVGKTTLRRRVEKQLKESMMEALRQDPGLVPVVSMEAAAPDSSQFSWKDYYRRALHRTRRTAYRSEADLQRSQFIPQRSRHLRPSAHRSACGGA